MEEEIRGSTDEGIKRLGILLLNLGLEPRLVDKHLSDNGQQVGNVDLVFQYENHFFLFEVSLQRSDRNEKILAWFQRFGGTRVQSLVRSEAGISTEKIAFRVYVDLTRDSDGEGVDVLPTEVRSPEKMCAVLFKDDIEYFEDSFDKVRLFARYDLLAFLGVHPQESSAPIRNATQFYMGDVYTLSFVVSADTLLKSAYVFRRRGQGSGYQRFLSFTRIREIEKKIRDRRILSFPNSVLINFERQITVDPRKERNECPATCRFELPTEYCSSRIVDGQHRLMGIARLPEEIRKGIFLQVIAFSQLPQALEVRTFVEINNNQRKVDRNLVLNLIADFTWPEGTSESHQRTAVLVARQLKRDRLVSVFFGAADEDRAGKIYLTTLVSALLANNLVGGRYYIWRGREFEALSEVFAKIRSPTDGFSPPWRNFLSTNRGISILLKLIYLLERNRVAALTTATVSSFLRIFAETADDSLLSEIISSYGGGGVRVAAETILTRLKTEHSEQLGGIESDLRRLRAFAPA